MFSSCLKTWVVCVCVCLPHVGWAQNTLQGNIKAGLEYDNNVTRQVDDVTNGDVLTRYFASLDGTYGLGARDRVSFGVRQGGKLFLDQDVADTLLTQLYLGYQNQPVEHLTLGLNVDMKDRTERTSQQDYNRGGGALVAAYNLGLVRLSAQGGWRYFAFKPDNATGSDGPTAFVGASVRPLDTLTLSLNYTWLSRRFDVRKFVQDDDGQFIQTDERRRDAFHVVAFDGRWRGPVILSMGVTYARNQSNSYGQDLSQLRAQMTLTSALFFGFYGSLHGELIQTTFEDPIFIDSDFQVDEDNRNTLVVSLSRPFGARWDVEFKYSLYAQAFGSERSYNRQTYFIALGCALD